jgi:hypothetical protein
MTFKLSRRRLFAASGGFMALPLLEALSSRRALAAGSADPRRLIMIHFPSGTIARDNNLTWFSAPDGPLTAANAPIPLQPFTANLGDITIPKFITQSARDATCMKGGGGHCGAKPCFFTGRSPADITSSSSTIAGDSFDVMYGKLTPQGKSLYLANAEQGGGDGVTYPYELSLKDGQRVVPELNPVSLYNTYFKNLVATTAPPVSDYARNPKILDVPAAAAASLRAKLGKSDRLRLDAYLSGLSDLKASLGTLPAPMPTCTPPGVPAVNMSTTNQNELHGQSYFDRMKAFNSLIASGFQCDLFRSVAVSFGGEGSGFTYDGAYPSSLNYSGTTLTTQGDHSLSHQSPQSGEPGVFGFETNMTRDRLHVYLVVDLINKLKAISDPSGSKVLDNTIVMAGFCVDDGEHGAGTGVTKGSPVMVCGGKNFITPGRSFDASAYDINDLYFTFSGLLGMGLTSFYPLPQYTRPFGQLTGRMSGSSLVPL